MKYLIDSIISHCRSYYSDGGFALLLVASILFLILWKKNREIKRALLWPVLLIGGILLCPLTAWVIMKLIGETVYWRVFWLLPVVPLAAFACVELTALAGDRLKKAILVVLCVVLVVVNGQFVFTQDYFTDRENNYKLPTEVIWVTDAINEHAQENRIKRKKIVAPMGISTYVRIYDASIIQSYGRNMLSWKNQSELCMEINAEEYDFDHLAERAGAAKCRYVVLNLDSDDEEAMEARNYQKIYESPSYAVYFNLAFEKKK